jgi:hypothetical protein
MEVSKFWSKKRMYVVIWIVFNIHTLKYKQVSKFCSPIYYYNYYQYSDTNNITEFE